MGFLHVMKDILKVGEDVAPAVVTVFNPAAGAIVGIAVGSIAKAQQNDSATNEEKKAQVMAEVVPQAKAQLSAAFPGATIDDDKLNAAVSSIVDGTVSAFNSVQPPQGAK